MEDVIRSDGRYPMDGYAFLHDGLARAIKNVHGAELAPGERQHVTGRQICRALHELALERWGMLAVTVLARWRIHQTIDFGNMVYLLIGHNFMHKTEDDSIEDFRDVYDFQEAFGGEGNFEMKE